MSDMCFSIVTVLYNSDSVVFDMLESIPPGIEIILVDNGDTPPDLSRLPGGVKYLKSKGNIGFGRACNDGAREARGEFILFLNPDAIVCEGFFEALSTAIATYGDCSVFCATTYAHGEICFPAMTWIERQLKGECSANIPGADLFGDCCVRVTNGGAFAIRRSLFLEMGGFDRNIFLYFEDDDFSWRLIQAGQPIIQVADARVDHALGTSTPPSCTLEFLRGYGKESATLYLRRKYRLPGSPLGETLKIFQKIVIFALSCNRRRLYHQFGRLKARLERMRPRGG